MTTATLEAKTTDFDVEDVEYLRHGDKPLLARVYKPRGRGAVSGAGRVPWRRLVPERPPDRERCATNTWRRHGIVSIALDFRSGNEDPYPASVQDINYAVRWAKAQRPRAEDAARPHRPFRPVERRPSGHAGRHAAARSALCGDPAAGRIAGAGRQRALRRDVVAGDQSAVSRYRHAKRSLAASPPNGPSRSFRATIPIGRAKPTWKRAIPMLALERGEKVQLPPAIWFQGRGDIVHDYKDADSSFAGNEPQRFVANYRKAGGEIALRLCRDGAPRRPFAGPDADRRHVRAHGGVRRQARHGLKTRMANGEWRMIAPFAIRHALFASALAAHAEYGVTINWKEVCKFLSGAFFVSTGVLFYLYLAGSPVPGARRASCRDADGERRPRRRSCRSLRGVFLPRLHPQISAVRVVQQRRITREESHAGRRSAACGQAGAENLARGDGARSRRAGGAKPEAPISPSSTSAFPPMSARSSTWSAWA